MDGVVVTFDQCVIVKCDTAAVVVVCKLFVGFDGTRQYTGSNCVTRIIMTPSGCCYEILRSFAIFILSINDSVCFTDEQL